MPYKDRDANRDKINKAQREYARKWRTERKDHFNKHNRKVQAKYRQSAGYKEYWEKLKKDPVRWAKWLERSKRYYHKNKDRINRRDKTGFIDLNGERYLIRSLQGEGLSRKIINTYPEIIEAKRLLLNIKRTAK